MLLSFRPLFRNKKKEKNEVEKSESFEELNDNETSNQVGEFSPEISVELDGPLEHISEIIENDKGMAPSSNGFEQNKNETMNGGYQLSPESIQISEDPVLPDKLKGD